MHVPSLMYWWVNAQIVEQIAATLNALDATAALPHAKSAGLHDQAAMASAHPHASSQVERALHRPCERVDSAKAGCSPSRRCAEIRDGDCTERSVANRPFTTQMCASQASRAASWHVVTLSACHQSQARSADTIPESLGCHIVKHHVPRVQPDPRGPECLQGLQIRMVAMKPQTRQVAQHAFDLLGADICMHHDLQFVASQLLAKIMKQPSCQSWRGSAFPDACCAPFELPRPMRTGRLRLRGACRPYKCSAGSGTVAIKRLPATLLRLAGRQITATWVSRQRGGMQNSKLGFPQAHGRCAKQHGLVRLSRPSL